MVIDPFDLETTPKASLRQRILGRLEAPAKWSGIVFCVVLFYILWKFNDGVFMQESLGWSVIAALGLASLLPTLYLALVCLEMITLFLSMWVALQIVLYTAFLCVEHMWLAICALTIISITFGGVIFGKIINWGWVWVPENPHSEIILKAVGLHCSLWKSPSFSRKASVLKELSARETRELIDTIQAMKYSLQYRMVMVAKRRAETAKQEAEKKAEPVGQEAMDFLSQLSSTEEKAMIAQ